MSPNLSMIYRFIDEHATFRIRNPQKYQLYFPLTDSSGRLLGSISPNLAGDLKRDNDHFLTVPASIEDIRNNLLCRREFFIRTKGRVFRLSQPGADTVEAGLLYQKVFKRCCGLAVEILNFIPHDLPVEVMRVRLTNRSSSAVPVTAFSFVPLFGRSEKNLRDHRHVSSLLNRVYLQEFGIVLRPTMVFDERGHAENTTGYYALGYANKGVAPQGQYPTLDIFLGDSDALRPDAVGKDLPAFKKKLKEFDGKEACGAFRFAEKKIAPGGSAEYFLLLGIADKEADIARTLRRLDRPDKVEAAFRGTQEYWRERLASLKFDFKDKDLNGWLSWVTLQPTLRRLFGCSFLPHFDYGKGGRGWRDLWQDALALLLTEPVKAGQIISRSFRGVRLDGSNATIITREGDFIADRNRISRVWMDHGVWPYLTTRLYVNRSGNLDFLLKGQTYFRDHQLRRARQTDKGFAQADFLLRDAKGRVYRGSILEHILIQNLVQFFNVGSHNIPRLENADWNDGMDMAADKGESAALGFMYCHNLGDLAGLLEQMNKKRVSVPLMNELALLLDRIGNSPVDYEDHRSKRERLERYFDRLRSLSGEKSEIRLEAIIADLRRKQEHLSSRLRKEWISEGRGQGFFNGYYDNRGRRVEGASRMILTTQVFAVMSGVADDEQIGALWRSLKRHLYEGRLKGFRLNTDFGPPQMDLGRAFGFSYGDKENGAFFNHMAVMLACALYSRGFVKEGREALGSVRAMALSELSRIPPCLPEYFNAQGRGLYLYLTGSASWYVYTLTQEVLGIKFFLGDLLIAPKLFPADIKNGVIDVSISFNRRTLNIRYVTESKTVAADKRLLEIEKVIVGEREIKSGREGFLIKNSLLSSGNSRINVFLK